MSRSYFPCHRSLTGLMLLAGGLIVPIASPHAQESSPVETAGQSTEALRREIEEQSQRLEAMQRELTQQRARLNTLRRELTG
ncbi:MAG: hypothetical protein H7327_10585, partial [Herminiimonas sp.]|nr:hypothetical protein [Herminiimonas sp.]